MKLDFRCPWCGIGLSPINGWISVRRKRLFRRPTTEVYTSYYSCPTCGYLVTSKVKRLKNENVSKLRK